MYADWTDHDVIRQWWYTYCRVLRGEEVLPELWALCDECEKRGIKGRPMTRVGSEDLADDADRIRRKNSAAMA